MKTPLPGNRRMAVIAIGDLGRSPRMLNHALELARGGVEVDLVGLQGVPIVAAVATHPRIRIHRLRAFERLRSRRGRLAFSALATGRQLLLAVQLAYVLAVRLRQIEVLLVQNPPAFPALPLALAHGRWRKARVVVDWHQTTAAMLELRFRRWGSRSRLAARLGGVEGRMARRADHHLCVSEALRGHLERRWSIDAAVVPDQAPERFAPPPAADPRHAGAADPRPAVVVAPSGWSADDDFDLLLERRAEVEARLRRTSWRRIEVRTAWYSPEEYPEALASADLGLSLHASAGGLDVPIKLCELLACGVPVLCLDYGPAVRERIRDGVNGRLFASATELADLLDELLGGFPVAPSLERLRAGVRAEPRESWESSWQRSVLPLLAPSTLPGSP
jgi:beta-1,4-mannosyltransferase